MPVNIKSKKTNPKKPKPAKKLKAGKKPAQGVNHAAAFRATGAVMVPPEDLVPYPGNAKTHPQEQIVAIRRSIREFGWDQPIVVDGDMVIIKGHGRREAAIQEGLKAVPVVVRDDLSEGQKRAARIADNRVGESPWDYAALRAEFEWLFNMEVPEFDMEVTGFPPMEIEDLLGLEGGDKKKTVEFEVDGDPEDVHLLLLEFESEGDLDKMREEVEGRGMKWKVL